MFQSNHFITALERRLLLSSDFAHVTSKGTLQVLGDSQPNIISMSAVGTSITATRDSESLTFDASFVRRVWVDGGDGSDSVANLTKLRSTLIGSAGNDTLNGGSGAD